jgi:hypothetical protein
MGTIMVFGVLTLALAIFGWVWLIRYRNSDRMSDGEWGWAKGLAVLGAIGGFVGLIQMTTALFVGSGADLGIWLVLIPIGLFVGCPLGGVAGAWLGVGIGKLVKA